MNALALEDQPPSPLSRQVVSLNGETLHCTSGLELYLTDPDGTRRRLDFSSLPKHPGIETPLFRLLTDLIATKSLSYASNSLRAFGQWLPLLKTIESELPLSALTELSDPKRVLPCYRPFILATLNRWHRSRLPGLSPEVESFLTDGSSWEEQGHGQYLALLSNDPDYGALTDQELKNVVSALSEAHAKGHLNLEDYTLAWFFVGTGARPVQAKRMRKGDVIVYDGPSGKEVILLVPLAKGAGEADQGKWRRRSPSMLAECLFEYLSLPAIKRKRDDDPLFDFDNPKEIGKRITHIFGQLTSWSTRLEGPVPITPYRFRYTLATRALAYGASDHEVARLLTHRTTKCIKFYRASMPDLQRPIRDKLGDELGLFAKAFRGTLIEDLSEATRKGDGSALIRDFLRLSGASVGACGTRTECHLHAPIACLGCPFFEPLWEAPWEELLANLEQEAELEETLRIRDIYSEGLAAIHEIIQSRDARREERIR